MTTVLPLPVAIFIAYLLFFRNPTHPQHILGEKVQDLHLMLVSMWLVLVFTLVSGMDYLIKNRTHMSMMRADLVRLLQPQKDNV